jgi:hypothetical protein
MFVNIEEIFGKNGFALFESLRILNEEKQSIADADKWGSVKWRFFQEFDDFFDSWSWKIGIDAVHLQGPLVYVVKIDFRRRVSDGEFIKEWDFEQDKICGWFEWFFLDWIQNISQERDFQLLVCRYQWVEIDGHDENFD